MKLKTDFYFIARPFLLVKFALEFKLYPLKNGTVLEDGGCTVLGALKSRRGHTEGAAGVMGVVFNKRGGIFLSVQVF